VLSSMQTDFMYDFLRGLGPHGSAASRVLFPFFCVLCERASVSMLIKSPTFLCEAWIFVRIHC